MSEEEWHPDPFRDDEVVNWLAGWFVVRVNREEQTMRDHFGSEYDDYARSTGRLIPRIRSGK